MSIRKDLSKPYAAPTQGHDTQKQLLSTESVDKVRTAWDETLMCEDSIELLKIMGNEAEREYKAGTTRKGGWGD